MGATAEARMTRLILAAGLALLALAAPADAQVTCRPSGLGGEVCVGVPAPEPRADEPFSEPLRGLGAVQARPRPDGGPGFARAGRTDALGNTFLTGRDLPPDRPLPGVNPTRNCGRDALGNLICR
jgi:hypothetical protein